LREAILITGACRNSAGSQFRSSVQNPEWSELYLRLADEFPGSEGNTSYLTRHEDYSWLTLITCQRYNERTGTYRYRRVVRAVLIEVNDFPVDFNIFREGMERHKRLTLFLTWITEKQKIA
jgi:hypothetical protein